MKSKHTYRRTTKFLASLLVLVMLLPLALQAKQLADYYCTMEMNHHEMMDGSHDCCVSDHANKEAAHNTLHDCETTQICNCTADKQQSAEKFVVPTVNSVKTILSESGTIFMVSSPDEFVYEDYYASTLEHSPPLYLKHDTFLN